MIQFDELLFFRQVVSKMLAEYLSAWNLREGYFFCWPILTCAKNIGHIWKWFQNVPQIQHDTVDGRNPKQPPGMLKQNCKQQYKLPIYTTWGISFFFLIMTPNILIRQILVRHESILSANI